MSEIKSRLIARSSMIARAFASSAIGFFLIFNVIVNQGIRAKIFRGLELAVLLYYAYLVWAILTDFMNVEFSIRAFEVMCVTILTAQAFLRVIIYIGLFQKFPRISVRFFNYEQDMHINRLIFNRCMFFAIATSIFGTGFVINPSIAHNVALTSNSVVPLFLMALFAGIIFFLISMGGKKTTSQS